MEENKEIKQENKAEKKQIKIKFKTFLIMVLAVLVILAGVVYYFVNNDNKCCEYEGEYQEIHVKFSNKYNDTATNNFSKASLTDRIITKYEEYLEIVELAKECEKVTGFKKYYSKNIFDTNNLAMVSKSKLVKNETGDKIMSVELEGNTANIMAYIDDNYYAPLAASEAVLFFIPIPKEITNINITYVSPEKYDTKTQDIYYSDKPVIYIYPEEETEVSLELGYPEKLTCVYPEYNEGWNVVAKPDGTLIDKETGREYYSLYYEAENTKVYAEESMREGFVISKEEIVNFLEEKLEILGLNYKEAEEFIIYWLPRLQANEYVYVRFQTMEEIEKNMPLSISQTPDTLIRIMMEWKGLDKKIEIEEQKLEPVTRSGFTVVEWGGTEIG